MRSCSCSETVGTSNEVCSAFPAQTSCGSRCGSYVVRPLPRVRVRGASHQSRPADWFTRFSRRHADSSPISRFPAFLRPAMPPSVARSAPPTLGAPPAGMIDSRAAERSATSGSRRMVGGDRNAEGGSETRHYARTRRFGGQALKRRASRMKLPILVHTSPSVASRQSVLMPSASLA